ncbi:MAG: hypothetical protein H5U08_12855 [Thermogutta sp.]|uniref:hypothetical protein n=1 Tax=Thermogutta sp. TaxID=1962930 RepID=UPI001984ECAD|nr:hypothetical protein [Thermogutta sp.]MBC7353244.1 hypothetical protein [Thermogutta sp.]
MVQELDGINGVKGTDNREGLGEHKPGSDMTTVVNHLIYDAFGRVTSESVRGGCDQRGIEEDQGSVQDGGDRLYRASQTGPGQGMLVRCH